VVSKQAKTRIVQTGVHKERATEWLRLLRAELDASEAQSQLAGLRAELRKGGLKPEDIEIGLTDEKLEQLAKCE